MNMFKSNGGFTLVELIVVIAILAILAGVAVPAYSGYISKANEAADLTLLDSVKTAAVFNAMEQNPEATVTKITINKGDDLKNIEIECSLPTGATGTAPTKADISELVTKFEFKSQNTKAIWLLNATGTEYESGWNLVK